MLCCFDGRKHKAINSNNIGECCDKKQEEEKVDVGYRRMLLPGLQ